MRHSPQNVNVMPEGPNLQAQRAKSRGGFLDSGQ